jgi:alpha-tubulin suppressor-like RCC1 family protein
MASGFTTDGSDFDAQFVRREFFQEGQLYVCGYNAYGTLGTNDRTYYSSPVQTVAGGLNWKQVSGGGYNNCGIKSDGTLWIWGRNTGGQLGDNTVTHKSSPIQTVAGGTNWKQVSTATSNFSVAAIKTDGTLWCWGSNSAGELGDNTSVNKSSPVQTIAAGWNWKQVSTGSQNTFAIKTDGTLWGWGSNTNGQLGDNTRTLRSSPVQTVSGGTNWKYVDAGVYCVAAIKTDGTLWGWGANNYGQLGTNDRANQSSPVQTVAGGTNWKYVSSSEATAGIKTDGTLWVWGWNGNAVLGTNDNTYRSSPVQTIAGGTNWKYVSVSSTASGGIKTDGTLWVWGANNNGQLGDNTRTTRSSPIQTVAGGTNWKQLGGIDAGLIALRE